MKTREEQIQEELKRLREWPVEIPNDIHMESLQRFIYEELRKLHFDCRWRGIGS